MDSFSTHLHRQIDQWFREVDQDRKRINLIQQFSVNGSSQCGTGGISEGCCGVSHWTNQTINENCSFIRSGFDGDERRWRTAADVCGNCSRGIRWRQLCQTRCQSVDLNQSTEHAREFLSGFLTTRQQFSTSDWVSFTVSSTWKRSRRTIKVPRLIYENPFPSRRHTHQKRFSNYLPSTLRQVRSTFRGETTR